MRNILISTAAALSFSVGAIAQVEENRPMPAAQQESMQLAKSALSEQKGSTVPISHWRPFYLPKEPHPLDGMTDFDLPTPIIVIEEMPPED